MLDSHVAASVGDVAGQSSDPQNGRYRAAQAFVPQLILCGAFALMAQASAVVILR